MKQEITVVVVMQIVLASGMSLISPHKNDEAAVVCGDPRFNDSWTVEIHVQNPSTFCYGVLISDRHVLTSSECKWTTTVEPNLGNKPTVAFPHIKPRIPNGKLENFVEYLSFASKPMLAVFELDEPIVTSAVANFSPICVPKEANNTTPCQMEAGLEETTTFCEPGPCSSEADNELRVAGWPLTFEQNDKIFVKGIRSNSCSNHGKA